MKRVFKKSDKGKLTQYFILRIDRQDYLFSIVAIKESSLVIVDNGYRSLKEALKYWPEAEPWDMIKKTRAEMIDYCKNGCPKPPHWTQSEFDDYYRSLNNQEIREIYEENINNELETINE